MRSVGMVIAGVVASLALVSIVERAGPALAVPRRPGRVLRVERPRLARPVAVRVCPTPLSSENKGTCYGSAPSVEDTAILFDFDRNYMGRLRVTSVGPSQSDPCDLGSIFDFTYELTPSAGTAARIPFALAVFGMELDPTRTRLVTEASSLPVPEAANRAQPWLGLDRDGNDSIDMVVTTLECTDQAPPPPGNRSGDVYCLDYWLADGSAWSHIRRDHLYTCL